MREEARMTVWIGIVMRSAKTKLLTTLSTAKMAVRTR